MRPHRLTASLCSLLLFVLAGCGEPAKTLLGKDGETTAPAISKPTAAEINTTPQTSATIITAASVKDGALPTSGGLPADATCWTEDVSAYLRQSGTGEAKQVTLIVGGVQSWQRVGNVRAHCTPALDWVVLDASYLVQVVTQSGEERWNWKPPADTWVKGLHVMAGGKALLIDLGEVSRKGRQLPTWVDLTTQPPTVTQLPEAGNYHLVEGGKILSYEDADQIRFYDGAQFLDTLTYKGVNASVQGFAADGASVLILDPTTKQIVHRRLTDGKGWSAPAPTDLGRAVLARDGSAVWILYKTFEKEGPYRLVMLDAQGKVRVERQLDVNLDPGLRDVTADGSAAVVRVQTAAGPRTCLIAADETAPTCYPIYDLNPAGTWARVGAAGSERWYQVSKLK